MAVAGVERLGIRDAPVADLLQSWPDRNGHLARLGEGHRYMQKLFDDLGYTGPPECFTMWCCLFAESTVRQALDTKPRRWPADHLHILRTAAAKYGEDHGMWPHPAVVVSAAGKQVLRRVVLPLRRSGMASRSFADVVPRGRRKACLIRPVFASTHPSLASSVRRSSTVQCTDRRMIEWNG